MIKRYIAFLGKYKRYAIIGPILVVLVVLLETSIPIMMQRIIDDGISSGNKDVVIKWGVLMIIASLLAMVFGGANAYYSSIASQGLGANIRSTLFKKIQRMPQQDVDKFSTSSLVTRSTSDVNNISNTFMMSLRLLLRAPLMFIASLAMAISINPKLSLILFAAIALLTIVMILAFKSVRPMFMKIQARMDKLNSVVQENVIAQRVVKAFVRRGEEERKFEDANSSLRDASVSAMSKLMVVMPMAFLTINLAAVAALWFGGIDVANGVFEVGKLSSFIDFSFQLLFSFIMISMMFMMVARTRASLTRVNEVLDFTPSFEDDRNSTAEFVDGSIRFENMDFAYESDASGKTLSGINLEVKSGEFLAIVGSTGSGKSTLVNLLPRLYEIRDGKLLVGGNSVDEYSFDHLRREIGFVPQKNVLFSGTVKENIRWGKPDASDEEVIEACKKASAHDFISEMPMGYDSVIEQGGTNVSGGQRQRLCIARALVRSPKILVLDDSTSALDVTTEGKIRTMLRSDYTNTTLIMIAQRISSVKEADRIVVMNDGKIDGVGTHEELLKANTIYQEIYQSQEMGVK